MKIINAMSEIGSYTLINTSLFISSSKAFGRYELTDELVEYITTQLLEAEYNDHPCQGYYLMFETEGLPEELEIVHPVALQEVFIIIVNEVLLDDDLRQGVAPIAVIHFNH